MKPIIVEAGGPAVHADLDADADAAWEEGELDDADDHGDRCAWIESLGPRAATDVLVFDGKYARAPRRGDDLADITLGRWVPLDQVFVADYDTDAHYVAYHFDGPPVRILKIDVEASPEDQRPVMTLLVFDVDDPEAHEQKRPASEDWRVEQRERVARLRETYPGAFCYETKGGYRIVMRIAPRRCDSSWAPYYLACVDHLRDAFGIVADLACKDYTRLFRLPRVIRDGTPERRPWVGDPSKIGIFEFVPTPESLAAHTPLVKPSSAPSARQRRAHGLPTTGIAAGDDVLAPLASAWCQEGGHEVNLAIAAILSREGWEEYRAVELVRRLNALVGGPWGDVAAADFASTYSRVAAGQPATGWPTLAAKAPGVARALKDLLAPDAAVPATPTSVRQAVEAVLLAPDMKAAERSRTIWRTVEEDLQRLRTLFGAQDGVVYSFDHEARVVEPVFDALGKAHPTATFAAFIGDRYGLNPSEKIFEFVLHEIRSRAVRVRQNVRRLAYYNVRAATLYVSDGAAGIYRLDGYGFDPAQCFVPNGTDDVYFVSRTANAVAPLGGREVQGALHRHLLGDLSLDVPERDRAATARLLEAFLLLPLFRELVQTVPVLVMVGPKGSGKSTTLRAYLKVLLGPAAEVQALPEKQDGFDALVARDRIVVLDNVDRYTDWLQDRLAVLSTGGELTRRTLYTDNTTFSCRPDALLAITTREPHFKRDDVVDRSLVVPLRTRETFEPEGRLLSRLAAARPEILGDLLHLADAVVGTVRDDPVGDPAAARVRMADFAAFALRVAAVRGDGEVERARLLEVMDRRQREFLSEGDPIVMALNEWIAAGAQPVWPPAGGLVLRGAGIAPFVRRRKYRASPLFEALSRTAEVHSTPWPFKDVRSLGRALSERKPILAEAFGMTVSGHANANVYAFDPPPEAPESGDAV